MNEYLTRWRTPKRIYGSFVVASRGRIGGEGIWNLHIVGYFKFPNRTPQLMHTVLVDTIILLPAFGLEISKLQRIRDRCHVVVVLI